jgi:hypothetical protein
MEASKKITKASVLLYLSQNPELVCTHVTYCNSLNIPLYNVNLTKVGNILLELALMHNHILSLKSTSFPPRLLGYVYIPRLKCLDIPDQDEHLTVQDIDFKIKDISQQLKLVRRELNRLVKKQTNIKRAYGLMLTSVASKLSSGYNSGSQPYLNFIRSQRNQIEINGKVITERIGYILTTKRLLSNLYTRKLELLKKQMALRIELGSRE